MLNSNKNIYTFLNVLELNTFFNTKTFFVLKDSYFDLESSKFFLGQLFKKLVSKSIYKNTTLSSFLTTKKIKFPLFFYFFDIYNLFENLFLNIFSNNLTFLFFKIKNKIFQFDYKKYPLVVTVSYSFKILNVAIVNFIDALFFRFFLKI